MLLNILLIKITSSYRAKYLQRHLHFIYLPPQFIFFSTTLNIFPINLLFAISISDLPPSPTITQVKLFPGSKRLDSTIQTNTWPKFNENFKFPLVPDIKYVWYMKRCFVCLEFNRNCNWISVDPPWSMSADDPPQLRWTALIRSRASSSPDSLWSLPSTPCWNFRPQWVGHS